MSTVLTSPQPGGIPGTFTPNVLVPASPPNAPGSNIVVIDNCVCGQNTSVKWIYTIKSLSGDKVVSGEVLALHRNGANPTHSRYGVIGDTNLLPHKVNAVIVGSSLGLEITNLSGGFINPSDRIDYYVTVVRIQILT